MKRMRFLELLVPLILFVGAGSANAKSVNSIAWSAPTCKKPTTEEREEFAFLGTLLSMAIGTVVEGGIKGLGDALVKAGSPKDINAQRTLNSHLYSVDIPEVASEPVSPTVSFARKCFVGIFGPKLDASTSAVPNQTSTTSPDSISQGYEIAGVEPLAEDGSLNARVFGAVGRVIDLEKSYVFVVEVESSDDGTAFRLVPKQVSFGSSFDGRNRKRDVFFTVSFIPPAGLKDGSATATRTFSFKSIVQREPLSGPQANMKSTSWMPLPPIPENVNSKIKDARKRAADIYALNFNLEACASNGSDLGGRECLLSAEGIKKARSDRQRLLALLQRDRDALGLVSPYSIQLAAKETRPGSKFLVRLGEFLSGNAEKLGEPIIERLDSEKRASAKEQSTAAVEALRITAITEASAYAKAISDEDETAARIAEIKLGAACRQIEAAGFSDVACLVAP